MEEELEVNNKRLSTGEQEQLRLRIIRTAKKNLKPSGKVNVTKVAEICECSKAHVSGTWKKYCEGGTAAVKAVPMGRPENSGKLTVAQQKEIKDIITDKCPDQLKLKGFLWDRGRVKELIYRRYKIKIAVQNVGEYLRKWGFTAQKPAKRNYKQKPEKVERWLAEEYPAIKERAKEEKAEIAWCDETGCQNESNYLRGYAPKGQTPAIPVNSSKISINMISAITNQGKLRFMFYKGSMDSSKLLVFLKRLAKETEKKTFLILDNLKTHHANKVRGWQEANKEKIELFFLPPYCPEYNPDEYLNGNLKREIAQEGYSETAEELESKARGAMMRFQNNPAHVASFFEAKYVKYAA